MRWSRRLAAAMGVTAVLAGAGCSQVVAGTPVVAGTAGADETGAENPAEPAGFDECSLYEPAELAEVLGIDAIYIVGREVSMLADGSRRAACAYSTDGVLGLAGMTISTVTDTDSARFFAPFEQYSNAAEMDLGDHAEVIALGGGGTHVREVRAIVGDTGLDILYIYDESPGGLPVIQGSQFATIAKTALENIPEDVTIADGAAEGPCADIDVAQAAEVLGVDLPAARSVLGDAGAMDCYFGGQEAHLEVIVLTDQEAVQKRTVGPDEINFPDIGDGAGIYIREDVTAPLAATVILGDRLVHVLARYGSQAGTVTEPRPEDVEMVRAIVAAVSG